MAHQESITRRNLPHWYVPNATIFVTYRLHGTIPAAVLSEMERKRDAALVEGGSEARQRVHKKFFAEFDACLDGDTSIRWLAEPRVAALIRKSLYFHDGGLHRLISYCVMPNHVHAVFLPNEEAGTKGRSPLTRIMHSLKSFTGLEANKLLEREGTFWQKESFDHWVRDEDELERIVAYIANNPVKAGLVSRPHEWYFSSAHDRFLADGCEEGWLWQPDGGYGSSPPTVEHASCVLG